MIDVDTGFGLKYGQAAEAAARTPLLRCMALLAVFIAAIMMRHVVAANSDVSWLLIACERWLDGQSLYSDILEINPPMAVLVYVPGILISRALGISTEIVVDGLVFLAIALSLGITALILRKSSVAAANERWAFAMVAVAVLAVLPVQSFGQREHIAFIELLPAMAVLAQRMSRETPTVWAIAIAGVGLGLAMTFKPHFAFPTLCCLAVAGLRLKSWRIFFATENLVAAAIVVSYGACTLMWFPEYLTVVMPLLRDVYSIGLPLSAMLVKAAVPLWVFALVATILVARDKAFGPALTLLITASLGFAAVYFLQRKGWPYHSYPMMAFALLALGCAITRRDGFAGVDHRRQVRMALAFMAVFMPSMIWFNHSLDARPVQAAVARLGLQHPSVLAITGDGGIPHPLVRAVGGVWASRQQSLFVSSYDRSWREMETPDQQTLTVLDGYAQRERQWLIEDFRAHRPQIVLVDNATDNWDSWLRVSPELVDLLKDYRLTETVLNVDIYVRRAD
jgi:hypothetical protein